MSAWDDSRIVKRPDDMWLQGHSVSPLRGDGVKSLQSSRDEWLSGFDIRAGILPELYYPYAWGWGGWGQLGIGTYYPSKWWTTPRLVFGEHNFSMFALGYDHSLGLEGTVGYSFGDNYHGELGRSCAYRTIPQVIDGDHEFVSLGAGENCSYGIDSDNAGWSCGSNEYGKLGIGSLTDQPAMTLIDGGLSFSKIDAYRHAVSFTTDGVAYAWGSNQYGEVGNGKSGGYYEQEWSPVSIGLSNVINCYAGGAYMSYYMVSDGTIYGCGRNAAGEMGNGTKTMVTTPQVVAGGKKFAAFAVGVSHCVGIDTDGDLWAWGYNAFGQLGDNTTTERLSPINPTSQESFAQVAAIDCSSFAVTSAGKIYACGKNTYDFLLVGDWVNRDEFTVSDNTQTWKMLYAGGFHLIGIATKPYGFR